MYSPNEQKKETKTYNNDTRKSEPKKSEPIYACMEIAAAESIEGLNVGPVKVNKNGK
jgi:hypothetical protein